MNEIVNAQILLFLTSIEIGIILGMVYDLVRIFRKLVKHFDWLIQIEDFLYWISCALIGFGILYMHNYSAIRGFIFLGMILGSILYFCTFSILFMKLATWIIDVIKKILNLLIHIFSIPIRGFIKILKIPLEMIGKLFGIFSVYSNIQKHKVLRKWYFKRADLRTSLRVRKNK